MKRPRSQYRLFKRMLFSFPAMLVLAVIVGVVAIASWNMYQTYRDTQQTLTRLQQERDELAARKQAAQTAAAEISTDRGLREEIRNKFSVAEPGERVIVLNDARSDQQATTSDEQAKSGWQRWLELAWPW